MAFFPFGEHDLDSDDGLDTNDGYMDVVNGIATDDGKGEERFGEENKGDPQHEYMKPSSNLMLTESGMSRRLRPEDL